MNRLRLRFVAWADAHPLALWLRFSAVIIVGAVALTACSAQLADRGGQEGAAPDRVSDVDLIDVARSADHFPNIAQVCVQGLGFATTSTGEGDSGGATPLIRVTDWDAFCASKRKAGSP